MKPADALVVPTDPTDDDLAPRLVFDEVRTRQELVVLSDHAEAQIADALRLMLHDPVHSADFGAVTGRNQDDLVLIAPCYRQSLGLPVKLGEKVLWRIHLPSARVLPSAQLGVRSYADARELVRWLRISRPKLAIAFTDVMTDTPLYAAAADAGTLGYHTINNQPAPHHFHCFRGSYDEFFREKQSKYKNQLRKREKTFRERFGSAFVIKEYRSSESVREFLDAANVINKRTYQYKLFGESVDNSAETATQYIDLAHRGVFRSFVLWHDAIPLCFILGCQSRDGVFQHQVTGFDPEWRDYAPGINCNILMLRKLYESDRPALLDFGNGDAEYKRLFANSSKFSASPILIPRTLQYFIPFLIHTSSARFNEVTVAALDRIGAKDKIKRALRRLS